MKVSYNAKKLAPSVHNDRRFEINKNTHIDVERTKENIYIKYDVNGHKMPGFMDDSFKDHEKAFYEKLYAECLELKNEYNIYKGHPERVRTIEDMLNGKNKPQELIFQVGNKDDDIDKAVFIACLSDYLEQLQSWSKDHNNCFRIMDVSVHLDEATPHAHIRGTWAYMHQNGHLDCCQNKALEQGGVQLPKPDQEQDRHNNRQMTFTAIQRDIAISVCRSHNLEIDDAPHLGKQGELDIHTYRNTMEKLDTVTTDIKIKEAEKTTLETEIEDLSIKQEKLQNRLDDQQTKIDDNKELLDRQAAQHERLYIANKRLNERLDFGGISDLAYIKKLPFDKGDMVKIPQSQLDAITDALKNMQNFYDMVQRELNAIPDNVLKDRLKTEQLEQDLKAKIDQQNQIIEGKVNHIIDKIEPNTVNEKFIHHMGLQEAFDAYKETLKESIHIHLSR